MQNIFNKRKLSQPNSLTTMYRREENLKEILPLSLFPPKFNKHENYISNCNKCNIILYAIINFGVRLLVDW